jgi:hypothetical protein
MTLKGTGRVEHKETRDRAKVAGNEVPKFPFLPEKAAFSRVVRLR